MDKLLISKRKGTNPSSVVSVRLPEELIARLDEIVIKTGRSRNEILIAMIEYSLKNIEISNDYNKWKIILWILTLQFI